MSDKPSNEEAKAELLRAWDEYCEQWGHEHGDPKEVFGHGFAKGIEYAADQMVKAKIGSKH